MSDFPADYVFVSYPNNDPAMNVCSATSTLNHFYCGSVIVLGTLYTNHAVVVDPTVSTTPDECGCCSDRWHRIAGNLVVTGTVTVANTPVVTPAPVPAPCSPVCVPTTTHVCGNLTLSNSLHVVGQIAPIPTCP